MKKLGILALILMLLLTGCQPTPETPVVVGKNDGDNNITALFGETSETEGRYEAKESWKEETQVTVPDVTKFPVVKVDDHVFTQEEADELLASLSEGNALFPKEMTRADKEELLLVMKARLAEFKAKSSPSESDLFIIADYEDRKIPLLEAEIKAMPEGATAKPFTTDFQPYSVTGGAIIEVLTDLGKDKLAYISVVNGSKEEVTNDFSMPSGMVTLNNETYDYWTIDYKNREVTKEDAIPAGTSVTREEATAQAEAVMRKVGLTDMRLVLTMPVSLTTSLTATDASQQCWMLIYVPVVNGIPIAMEKNNMYARYRYVVSGDEEYIASFSSPVASFHIIDDGIDMWWNGPIDIQETLNENAVLLPFDQIQERIKQQLLIKYVAKEGITEVHVTRVELAYMRARIKDTQDGYMLIPV